MWIVAEGQDYEGCYEHIGPFDTEQEAEKFANRCRDQNKSFRYWWFEVIEPDQYRDQNSIR